MPGYRPQNMIGIFQKAADQMKQRRPELTHNQKVRAFRLYLLLNHTSMPAALQLRYRTIFGFGTASFKTLRH